MNSELEHRLEQPATRTKHTASDLDCELPVFDWIREGAEKSMRVTKTEIIDYCTPQFQLPITRGGVNSFVLRHADEKQRLHVPQMFLDRTIRDLNERPQRYIAELVFILGDIGISDWEDCKTRPVVAPVMMGGETIHH
jgi:hypothetical protein